MGCCNTVKKPQTLRNETSQVQSVEGKGVEQFKGKEAKEVVKVMEIEDMLLAIKTQNFQLIEAICVKDKLDNVCEV